MLNAKELGQSRLFLICVLSIALIFAGGFYYVLEGAKVWNLTQFSQLSGDRAIVMKQREKLLDVREQQLNQKEDQLRDLFKRFEIRQEQWQNEKAVFLIEVKNLDQKIEGQEHTQEASVEKLAHIYEKMETRKAAQLISGLDNSLAAQLLLKIQSYASAQILSEMVKINPEKAIQISQKMKLEATL